MPIRDALVSTVETAAAVAAAVAFVCITGTLLVVRSLPAPARRPYHWLVGGVAAGVAGQLVAAGMIHAGARITAVAVAVAALGIGAAVLLAAGLLGLLGPHAGRGPKLRHVVDGLIVGACIFFIGWLIFINVQADAPELGISRSFVVIAGPAWIAAWLAGLAAMTIARSVRPRRVPVLASIGVVLTAAGGLTEVMICCLPQAVTLITTAWLTCAGYVCLAAGAGLAARAD